MASSTVWPLSGFLSSAVKSGMPFRNSTRSRLFSFLALYRTCRATAKKFAAYSRRVSWLSPLAGRKNASRNAHPMSFTPPRRTLSAPRRSISDDRRVRNRSFTRAP